MYLYMVLDELTAIHDHGAGTNARTLGTTRGSAASVSGMKEIPAIEMQLKNQIITHLLAKGPLKILGRVGAKALWIQYLIRLTLQL